MFCCWKLPSSSPHIWFNYHSLFFSLLFVARNTQIFAAHILPLSRICAETPKKLKKTGVKLFNISENVVDHGEHATIGVHNIQQGGRREGDQGEGQLRILDGVDVNWIHHRAELRTHTNRRLTRLERFVELENLCLSLSPATAVVITRNRARNAINKRRNYSKIGTKDLNPSRTRCNSHWTENY